MHAFNISSLMEEQKFSHHHHCDAESNLNI